MVGILSFTLTHTYPLIQSHSRSISFSLSLMPLLICPLPAGSRREGIDRPNPVVPRVDQGVRGLRKP